MPPRGASSPVLGIGPKEEKGVKESRKMFKQIGKVASKIKGVPGAIGAIGAGLESVMPFLEALAPLFQAFEPILSIFNAMFTAFAGALTAELIPALQPLFAALIDMIPIFTELGGIVGGFIAALLVPLVDVLITIIPIFATFLTNLLQSEEFLTLINVATALFVSGLTFLIDNIDLVIFFVSGLMGAFVLLTGNLEIVVPFIYAFINAIFDIIEVLTLGIISLGGGVMPGFVVSLPPSPPPIMPPPSEETTGIQMQRGTDVITRTGAFWGHAGEAITPATEVGLQTGLLEEIRDLQREQLLEAKWRMR